MIPRIWRYLFFEQLKATLLAWLGAMALFTLLRIEEIARFAALGAPVYDVLRFAWIILPQLMILAIPLASFIGVYLSWQRFSQSCELLGALTCGMRLEQLVFPNLCLACLLSAANGWIALDVAPQAQLEAKKLKTYWSHLNPTHLLRSEPVWQLPGATIVSCQKKQALELYLFSRRSNQQSQLIYLDQLSIDDDSQLEVAASTHILLYPPSHPHYLSLENVAQGNYSYFLNSASREPLQLAADQLPLRALLDYLSDPSSNASFNRSRGQLELPRRLFFLLLPLSFAFLALTGSIHPDRRAPSPSSSGWALWILLLLVSYFATKGFAPTLWLGLSGYLAMPLFALAWSWHRIRTLGAL